MERKGIYNIQQIFDWVEADSDDKKVEYTLKKFEDVQALSSLLGYRVFKNKGVQCPCCPTQGEYFALERTPGPGKSLYNNWHFNLYGTDKFGKEVMITKDHITPKSKGGPDELSNLQPMCMKCNTKKGSTHMKEFEARIQGRSFEWNTDHAEHVIKRIKERYNLDMDLKEYGHFLNNIMHNGVIIHTLSNSKSYRMCKFKKTDVYAVYSAEFKSIYTVLDPNKIDERLKDVPRWGKDRKQECLDLYDKIMMDANSTYKTFGTARETAEYFKGHKYPKLMFAMWKDCPKTKYRTNAILWSIVRCTLKIDKLNNNEDYENEREKGNNLSARELCSIDSGKQV